MKKWIAARIVLTLLLAACLAAPGLAQAADANAAAPAPAVLAVYNGTQTPQASVRLRIVTVEGEKLLDGMVVVVDEQPTAYMALKAGLEAAGMPLELIDEDAPDKMFINGIADLKSENPSFWMFYVNQEMAQLGIGTQGVQDGDVLEFIYGDYNLGYVDVP